MLADRIIENLNLPVPTRGECDPHESGSQKKTVTKRSSNPHESASHNQPDDADTEDITGVKDLGDFHPDLPVRPLRPDSVIVLKRGTFHRDVFVFAEEIVTLSKVEDNIPDIFSSFFHRLLDAAKTWWQKELVDEQHELYLTNIDALLVAMTYRFATSSELQEMRDHVYTMADHESG